MMQVRVDVVMRLQSPIISGWAFEPITAEALLLRLSLAPISRLTPTAAVPRLASPNLLSLAQPLNSKMFPSVLRHMAKTYAQGVKNLCSVNERPDLE
jgi:hypothetical protein